MFGPTFADMLALKEENGIIISELCSGKKILPVPGRAPRFDCLRVVVWGAWPHEALFTHHPLCLIDDLCLMRRCTGGPWHHVQEPYGIG